MRANSICLILFQITPPSSMVCIGMHFPFQVYLWCLNLEPLSCSNDKLLSLIMICKGRQSLCKDEIRGNVLDAASCLCWPTGSPAQASEPLAGLAEHPLAMPTTNRRCPSPHTMAGARRRRENRASTHNTRHQRWPKPCL